MVAPAVARETPSAVAVNVQFTRGRYGAAARIEWRDRPAGRCATIALRGWIDDAAQRGLERALEDFGVRGVGLLIVDWSQLSHIDYRSVPAVVAALSRFEARSGAVVMQGMSRYVRDLFRLAGCDAQLGDGPAPGSSVPDRGGEHERAS